MHGIVIEYLRVASHGGKDERAKNSKEGGSADGFLITLSYDASRPPLRPEQIYDTGISGPPLIDPAITLDSFSLSTKSPYSPSQDKDDSPTRAELPIYSRYSHILTKNSKLPQEQRVALEELLE